MMTLRAKTPKNLSQSKTPKSKSSLSTGASSIQTFTHHIRELRRRLFLSVIVGLVVGSAVYYYHDFFIKIVMEPLGSQKLIYLTPAGGFSFVFMVTFYITILAMLPFILYQIYAFIKPAIPKHTRELSLVVGVVATLLMVAGATFGYLFAVPGGLNFLSNFASEYVTACITADSYLSFVLGYVLGIGILFELPLLLLFWHWIHPLTPKGLMNSERFVIVGAFISAAILSPSPDALSQAIIAVPIIAVYQLGVAAVLISIRRSNKLERKAPIPASAPKIPPPERVTHKQPVSSYVATISTPAAPTKVVSSTAHRRPSMDGIIVAKPSQAHSVVAPPAARSVPVRPRSTLVVAPRPRMISDFRPIRNSIIDISR